MWWQCRRFQSTHSSSFILRDVFDTKEGTTFGLILEADVSISHATPLTVSYLLIHSHPHIHTRGSSTHRSVSVPLTDLQSAVYPWFQPGRSLDYFLRPAQREAHEECPKYHFSAAVRRTPPSSKPMMLSRSRQHPLCTNQRPWSGGSAFCRWMALLSLGNTCGPIPSTTMPRGNQKPKRPTTGLTLFTFLKEVSAEFGESQSAEKPLASRETVGTCGQY
ncbi:hypothetical protein B0H11DRAFT_2024688, partial [Mycena galericulata]